MNKTNVFFLKKPNKWELCHLYDMVDLYLENDEKIHVYKDIKSNNFILVYYRFNVSFNNLKDLCELLYPYYSKLAKEKKNKKIDEYFKLKFTEELLLWKN